MRFLTFNQAVNKNIHQAEIRGRFIWRPCNQLNEEAVTPGGKEEELEGSRGWLGIWKDLGGDQDGRQEWTSK